MRALINRLALVTALILAVSINGHSEIIIERIVAYVDDYAITLTDLKDAMRVAQRPQKEEEAVEALINRVLLLREARKMKLEGQESALINEYIEIKIKSLIFIREEDIQGFYEANLERFKGATLTTVKDKIELYLIEEETNRRLMEHIKSLRERADIKVQLKTITNNN